MALFDEVKSALRVKTTDTGIDSEIRGLIAAAASDLMSTGISVDLQNEASLDPLVKLAIIVHAKAQFGFDNPDAIRFMESYDSIKHKLMNAEEYRNEI